MKPFFLSLLLVISLTTLGQSTNRIPVRVVVVTMFEIGADTGDRPGEFQYWVERLPLSQTIPFPQGYRDLRYNPDKQVLGICTGMGTARSAASIMALGMDPRFDLSKAYWLVAGIAGIDPNDGSAGSAVWAEWLVDGDLAHEIDPREIPSDWSTGYLPLRRAKPYEEPVQENDFQVAYHLNPDLAKWAYSLTKAVKLDDSETLQKMRAVYRDFPEAQKPPRVMMGDHIAAMTFWHGKYLNDWANQWVSYWTGGKGNFVTSAMEDTGTGQSLQWLTKAGKADINRYMVLRTASNYTMQPSGVTAAQNLTNGGKAVGERYTAYIPALEAAYRTGVVVVDKLIGNWNTYQTKTPSENK
ncbi:purine nucleoside permease [Spirosoma panaciterrae]|uniref:purine nucleoside permease n=1 Tax=Spirosoma panaciterrae TaxID=496058 RepID=UPI00037922B4|nr:purine nucleoside permease [Spirosoma panaciterrae]